MKKLLTTLLLIVPITLTQAAETLGEEERESSGLTVGVHVGTNITEANINSDGASGSYAGFVVGLDAQTDLIPSFLSLSTEINFLRVGAENNAFGGLATTRMDYFEIPVLVKAQIPLDTVSPYFVAGPRFTYLLGASTSAAGISVDRSTLNDIGLGAYLGAGVELNFGSFDGTVTARYLMDLTDADDGDGEWRTDGIQLLVGVRI